MLSLSAYSCREAFLINYIIKKLEKYNPQNEMLPFHKTKCSETQNEASSL